MKKFLASILTLALCLGLATGCAGKQIPAENDTESAGETGVKEIPSLKIAFSPYADADQHHHRHGASGAAAAGKASGKGL